MTGQLDTVLEARPIDGAPFGWEVDVDLTRPLSEAQKEALREVWRRDGLVLFRGQELSMDQQLDACEIFGPVLRGMLDNYLVSNTRKDGLLGKAELLFHNDIPFVPAPYLGGSLHALEVAPDAAPTRFASAFKAWERLPGGTKARVEHANALHVQGHLLGRRTMLGDLSPRDACAVHAVQGRQERTGRPYLFVNEEMTTCFTHLPPEESEALLGELFGTLYDAAHVYDHHWRKGDLVIWDNLAVQHARSELGEGERTLQRVTIAEFGYWQQVPSALKSFDELQQM